MDIEKPMNQERSKFVANLHTDASAPIVHGFTVEGTGDPKDLTKRNSTDHRLVMTTETDKTIAYANQWDVPRAQAGKEKLINLVAFTCGEDKITGEEKLPTNLLETYKKHDWVYNNLYHRAADQIQRVTNHIDLQAVMDSQKIGGIQSIEGVYGEYNEYDIEEITNSAKIWTIWWNFSDTRTGADNTKTGTDRDTGLTDEGRNLIRMLSKDLKVAVDLSHASDNTTLDALDTIAQVGGIPAIATHSGLREIVDHNRNLPDYLAYAIARQDGIIGLPVTATFMKDIDGFIRTVERFAQLGILDHVAFGPDFDGMPAHRAIPEAKDPEVVAKNLPGILREVGLSEQEIRGVLFENAFRYFDTYLFPAPKNQK